MLRRVLDVLPQGVALVAHDGMVLWVNAAWREFPTRGAGPVAATVGVNYFDVCRRAAEAGEPVARSVLSALTAAVDGEDPGETSGWEYATHGLGVQRWFRVTVRPLADPAGPLRSSGAVVMHEDVTARVLAERAYRRRAFDDPVTGLANELLFTDRAARAIAAAARSGRRAGLVLLDVPGVDLAGDGSSRPAVRRVLRAAAERVRADVRRPDLVARWVGGTLVVLADDVRDLADLAAVAGRLGRVVAEAAYGGDHGAARDAGGGRRAPFIGLATSHATDTPHDLFTRAERSLSRCRARGGLSLLGLEAAPVPALDDGVVIDVRGPVEEAATS
jgi:diguanylate cyclase (GGDEF)-like protein